MDPILNIQKSNKSYKVLWISVIVVIIVGVAVGAFVWYWTQIRPGQQMAKQIQQQFEAQLQQQQKAADAAETVVSPPTLDAAQVTPETNPVENKVPEVNPIERANPFREVYTNPFE